MENSLLAIFDEIWPMTLYYSTGCFCHNLEQLENPLKEATFLCEALYVHVHVHVHYYSLCLLISICCINWFSKQVESSLLCVCVYYSMYYN